MNPLIAQNALQAAALLIQSAVGAAGQRLLEQLAPPATELCKRLPRMEVGRAQMDWQINVGGFNLQFSQTLRDTINSESRPLNSTRSLASTTFEALSLVDDHSEDERVTAHRLSSEIEQDCEWELRELDSLVGSLLAFGRPDHERNPLRPEIIGRALFRAMDVASRDADVRRLLLRELGHTLSPLMRPCYRAIIDDLKARGVEPVDLALRTVEGPGNDLARDSVRGGGYMATGSGAVTGSGYQSSARDTAQALHALSSIFGIAVPSMGGGGSAEPPASGHRPLSGGGGAGGGYGGGQPGGASSHSGFDARGHGGAGMGGVASDAQVVDVIRRLAALGSLAADTGLGLPHSTSSRATLGFGTAGGHGVGSMAGAAQGFGLPAASHGGAGLSMPAQLGSGMGGGNAGLPGLMAVNMIRAHREELIRASSGTLDQLVIDVVATMFDQVLSDSKVAPQMARQIARLQMPVLRAALKDVGFFSSRKHPVRRFVNRIATLAAAYEDFDEGPGKVFLERVRELVQQIVEGDFDQMELYESKLQALETLLAEQSSKDAGPHAAAAQLLDDRETELRIQQRYMRELQQRLTGLPAPEFLRNFLAQVWSQVVVLVNGPKGNPELATRIERVASELVLSVQPKGEPALRRAFLLKLPQLMKDLNEGMALIRWPEEAKKDFYAKLLPTHAESLKQAPSAPSAIEALQQQLEALAAVPIPKPQDLAAVQPGVAATDLPPPEAHAAPLAFSAEEAQQVGLVEESAVDWTGEVDIDLGEPGSPGSAEIDIVLDGPLAEGAPPTHGVGLMEHLQTGIAYRMHLNGSWQRVRLSWASPGRAFFVFTHGKANQKTISMTARMLARMCETERFRAYEQAELIERATMRARRQLAQIGAPTTR
ncbi:DUF1631 family protein [Rivibacter subsaxonicus]|uniref:Uncharacterized protein DUF1631 n=1 Tax=Rivibacter subsaxonicus TaxID=457575 RepID=A0A4Q7VGS5_9BURK|nr:DUF1631 family protein [Rivibacter subsaxonicus]RZT95168.1 uncharacterized protein DUF1631 [Rivibacter subsaxonicus]